MVTMSLRRIPEKVCGGVEAEYTKDAKYTVDIECAEDTKVAQSITSSTRDRFNGKPDGVAHPKNLQGLPTSRSGVPRVGGGGRGGGL